MRIDGPGVHVLAYLDPGTGSMLIGAVAAGAAGAGVAVKSTLARFRRKPRADAVDAAENSTSVDVDADQQVESTTD